MAGGSPDGSGGQNRADANLVEKQQLDGLTDLEKQEAAVLSHFFNRVMLVRAKAAVLLKERAREMSLPESQSWLS